MLYVFHVDKGIMVSFDMNLAVQTVSCLQESISVKCEIPVDKQVLIISGGENLDSCAKVCSYQAGTDTNPVFLFSKCIIESSIPPSIEVEISDEITLKEQVEDSLRMSSTYQTVVTRTQLSLRISDVASREVKICENLVHDQHLQYQGWTAVIANLEEIMSAFKSRSKHFDKKFNEFLSSQHEYSKMLANFPHSLELLSKIPLLPCLINESSYPEEDTECISMEGILVTSKTLLDWITARDSRASLEQIVHDCQVSLTQFTSEVLNSLMEEVSKNLKKSDNSNMKEVKGLDDRLAGLEQLIINAKKLLQEQSDISQGFVQNQNRMSNLKDNSILPDLCNSHKQQLMVMLQRHQSIQDIKRRCICAKEELSANLHTRLRWVMFVEKNICDLDSKMIIHYETLKKLKRKIEIAQQISSAPILYLSSVAEVLRRREFSKNFLSWAQNLSQNCKIVHEEELEKRSTFSNCLKSHFLKTLFPGMDDSLPNYALDEPDSFDNKLPYITIHDLELVQSHVPELAHLIPSIDSYERLKCLEPFSNLLIKKMTLENNCLSSSSLQLASMSQSSELCQNHMQELPPGGAVFAMDVDINIASSPMQPCPLLTPETFTKISCSEKTCKDDISSPKIENEEFFSLPPESLDQIKSYGPKLTSKTPNDKHLNASNLIKPSNMGDVKSSPEFSPDIDEMNSDGFCSADFYIDESMPSSITESPPAIKLKELQQIVLDKNILIEKKERDIIEQQKEIKSLNFEKERMGNIIILFKKQFKILICDYKADINKLKHAFLDELNSIKSYTKTTTFNIVDVFSNYDAMQQKCRKEHYESLLEQHKSDLEEIYLKLDENNMNLSLAKKEITYYQNELNQCLKDKELFEKEMCKKVDEIQIEQKISLENKEKQLILEHEVELESLKYELSTDLTKKDKQITDLHIHVSELKNALETSQSEIKHKIEQIELEYEKKNENNLHEQEKVLTVKHNDVMESTLEALKNEHAYEIENNLKRNLENQYNEMKSTLIDSHQNELMSLKESYELKIDAFNQKNELDIHFREEAKNSEIKAAEQKYCEILSNMIPTIEHNEKIRQLEDELDSRKEEAVKETLQRISSDFTNIMRSIIISYRKDMELLCGFLKYQYQHILQSILKVLTPDKQHIFNDSGSDFETVFENLVIPCCGELSEYNHEIEESNNRWKILIDELTSLNHLAVIMELEDAIISVNFIRILKNAMTLFCDYFINGFNNIVSEHESEITIIKKDLNVASETDMQALKMSLTAESQTNFNEALNSVVIEKDKQIDTFKQQVSNLSEQLDNSRLEISMLQSKNITLISECDFASTEAKTQQMAYIQLQEKVNEFSSTAIPSSHSFDFPSTSSVLSSTTCMSQSLKDPNFMTQSIVPVAGVSSSQYISMSQYQDLENTLKSKNDEIESLKHKLMTMSMTSSVRSLAQDKVSITTCQVGDIVLLCLDERHDHYVVFNMGSILHFLHSDCLESLSLKSNLSEHKKSWILAEITEKEFCQAKKSVNRFKVPLGTKFYRVKAKPWNKEAALKSAVSGNLKCDKTL